jgi:hypothetical protein
MEIKPSGEGDVGERREFLEEQDQASPLPEVRRCGASVGETSSLGEELVRKDGAMKRRRAGHETTPGGSAGWFAVMPPPS